MTETDYKNVLDAIFYPESVAIIGASNSFNKWGSFITAHLIVGGYMGQVYPVNPKEEKIFGRNVYKKIGDVPGKVDLAVVATPAKVVPDVVKECIEKKVKSLVIVTSGFSETGDDGKRLEEELAQMINKAGIPMVGPNTMGALCTQKRLFTVGSPIFPRKGSISFVTQSGNLGVQMLEWAENNSVGISKMVGSGNEACIAKEHYIEYLAQDKDTRVIMLYLEGVDDGSHFLEAAKKATLKKPIIALKGGRTAAGGRAAHSHTGSMAGDSAVMTSVFRQSGIIEAKNASDMYDLSMAFDSLPLPRGDRVGIITLGGGWGVLTTDALVEQGLCLATLDDSVIEKLDTLLPPFWSRSNPIDLVGQVIPDVYMEAVQIVTECSGVDAVICLGMIGISNIGIRTLLSSAAASDMDNIEYYVREAQEKYQQIEQDILSRFNELMNQLKKPIINVSLYSGRRRAGLRLKSGYSEVIYTTPEKAVQSLVAMYNYYKVLKGHGVVE